MPTTILFSIRERPFVTAGAITALGLTAWLTKSYFIRNVHAQSPSSASSKIFTRRFSGQSLRLVSTELVNHNTKRLHFAFPDSEARSGLPLTSAILTFSWPEGRWFPVVRPYTPISLLDEAGSLELLIKRYPNGKASGYLHSLTPGSTLYVLALPGVKWKANSVPHVTLIAGGAGITPIYQLTQGILRNPEDKTSITLLHGVNNDEDVLLAKEFEGLEKEFPGRFKRVVTVSKPSVGSGYRKGYVDINLLEEVREAKGKVGRGEEKVYVSGPPAMEKALTGRGGVLEELGYRRDQVVKF